MNTDIESIELYKELAEKYQLLAENTVECIWLLDFTNMQFKYISPAITSLRGLTVEEAMKEKLEDSLTPESLEKVYKIAENYLSGILNDSGSEDTIASINEFRQYCKDGTIKDVEISTRFVKNEKENTIDVLGVTRDITERKKLEEKLRKEMNQKNEFIKKLKESKKELIQLTEELRLKNGIFKNAAITDKLTGLHNRYFFDQKVKEEFERADRYKIPVSLILFDLDHFKKVNDLWGHGVGDNVLKTVSKVVKGLIRKPDVFARWGGEEFVILMPQTTLEGAFIASEKLREEIGKLDHPSAGMVTASFGCAEWLKGESYESWFKRVDHALYRAKSEGRNRVIKCNDIEIKPFAFIRLEWRKEWECGNELIDSQHKELLDLSNIMIDASLTEKKVESLLEKFDKLLLHIVQHFENEEQVLKRLNFPETVRHSQIHKDLTLKALSLKEELIIGVLKPSAFFSFLVDEVIMGHLLAEDVKFFPFTQK